jgi:hypothetical protein
VALTAPHSADTSPSSCHLHVLENDHMQLCVTSLCVNAVPCCAVLCSVCRLELSSMGPLKTLPYLVMFMMSNAGGWAGDALILRQHRSVAAARKAVNTLGEEGGTYGGG